MLVVMFPANVYAAGDVPWGNELSPRTATQAVFLAATFTVLVRHGRAVAVTCAEPSLSSAPPRPPQRP
ncbi:hypothetical protein ACIQMR_15010 [Streptomyces sp. NPDC091376]|uniref:hypothetical protein n=1 Tax=Streptomyces sp. NPDC091376 TaxID=3365994 RepID=UPI00380892C6